MNSCSSPHGNRHFSRSRLFFLLLLLTLNVQLVRAQTLHTLTVNFSMMSPHVGQDIYLAVIDAETMTELHRVHVIGELTFVVEIPEVLEDGKSYYVDFYADNNQNGHYDPPSADHAWRLEIIDSSGDETLSFSHQIAFTDIAWKHRLRLSFAGMAANVGQKMVLYVRDQSSGDYLDTVVVESIPAGEFVMDSYVIGNGGSFQLDFFADVNGNDAYDVPPTDQAWRLLSGATVGDHDMEFTHNEDYTDIFQATGLEPEGEALGISVFPNPASTFLNISMDEEPGSVVSISVLNQSGMVLSMQEERSPVSIHLDIGQLPGGMYLLLVESNSRQSITPFIKQ